MGKDRIKITLIVHDLNSNPIVRAYPIALALEKLGYEVEIAGFLIRQNEVYKPYADKFNYKTVFIGKGGTIDYIKGVPKLLHLITGDVIYAFKPKMTTYFVGLIKSRFGIRHKLIMDAEDDELFFDYKTIFHFVYHFFYKGWNNPNSHFKLLLLHLFLFPAKIKTVVGSKLQKRYRGTIVLHGPDEIEFDPQNFDQKKARTALNLPQDKILILFAGIPRVHKGIDTIIKALQKLGDDKFVFIGAGPSSFEGFVKAKQWLGDQCLLLGEIDNEIMPLLLSAVDIVPILQKKSKYTESQIPAKLFEAMAMEKIIIATDTSDIGTILGKNDQTKRGFIIGFDDTENLIKILLSIKCNPDETILMRKNARKYFLKEACVGANVLKLKSILQ